MRPVADHLPHGLGQFADRQVLPAADVDRVVAVVVPQQQGAGTGQVVHVQELPARCAASPQRDLVTSLPPRLVESADQRGQHVRTLQIEGVSGPVEVRRHRADVGGAELPAVTAHLGDAGDLRQRVGLVGGFQRAGEQRVLGDGLRGVLGVDARGAEEQQPRHAGGVGAGDDAELDAQVVLQERHRLVAVGQDAAHLRGRQHHGVGAALAQPPHGGLRVPQVQVGTVPGEHPVAFGGQPPGHGGADQTTVPGDEHPGAGRQQRYRSRHVATFCQRAAGRRGRSSRPTTTGGFTWARAH